jgi:hypothetical protein
VSSYLSETAGGVVVGSSFADEAAAGAALDLLRSSGVRSQDISVIARDAKRADRIAADRAWSPSRNASGLRRLLPGSGLPSDVRRRYRDALRAGRIVVVVAADGQPADTIAALFAQAKGEGIEQWWQAPAALFAPPELAGPF